ncbi:Glycosyltransferase, GT2 family [Mycobacterium numidiamassiliense]|uniref:Glycosyltransferase, GT2 family n=1 Tax=Mycobacterium numidiamassiliense TaxID=1841861 RepID=A0A2U3PH47_9MYCO|nr:glycosyltransferase family 2 protein [Mycobacterium numidiamassiliense]SPM43070.1 Glycosyltransferase, GT2 family [Mycobacterium numidiamassiliense]
MTAPTFSIIVPALNVASTLSDCLDSLVQQTWTDFELVLVDGGSTDGTLDIADTVAPELGARMILDSRPDRGAYDAMNRGTSLATGTWVLFLGADDTFYEADTLARVAAFIAEHDHSDLVYGDVIMQSTSFRHAGVFDLDRLLFETNICHQSIFYRRELFDSIGPYNLRYPVWADWDFNIRCFSNPALVTRYMDIVIARYNDKSGVSAKVDTEFRKRLPAFFWASAIEMCRRTLLLLRRKESVSYEGNSSANVQHEIRLAGFLRIPLPPGNPLRRR